MYEEAVRAYEDGLKIEPDNAQLKKGIDEVDRAIGTWRASPLPRLIVPAHMDAALAGERQRLKRRASRAGSTTSTACSSRPTC